MKRSFGFKIIFITIFFGNLLMGQISGMIIYKSDGTNVRAQISPANSIVTIDSIKFSDCVDANGNVYNTVKIGTQWWMAENLKSTKYRDGTDIPHVTDNSSWASLSTGAYCYHSNNAANAGTYGALYNWYAVNNHNVNANQFLAPEGWHIATKSEITTLINYLGSSVAGKKLKSIDGWSPPGTDDVGFGALPAGYREGGYGSFQFLGEHTLYWWPDDVTATQTHYWHLSHLFDFVNSNAENKKCGLSIRCVKDAAP